MIIKWILGLLLVGILASACAPNRVLVRDCQDAGPGLQNCEKVKDLP